MKKKHKLRNILLSIFIPILSLILIVAIIFFIYTSKYYHATSDTSDYLVSNESVEVIEYKHYYMFKSTNSVSDRGYIFYPGGKVEARAYAPMLNIIAESGITTFLVKMPFNLAIFDMNRADDIKDKYDDIDKWYIGGHSLGGAMASSYLAKNKEDYKGLVLLGAYSTKDLSDTNLAVLSIIASNDLILNKDKYNKYKSNLPSDMIEYIVEGGIHSYFGDYGHQKNDGIASITKEEQRAQIVNQTVNLIKSH